MLYLVSVALVLSCQLDQAFALIDASGRYVWDPMASLRALKDVPQQLDGLKLPKLEVAGLSGVDTSRLAAPDMSALLSAVDSLDVDRLEQAVANFGGLDPTTIDAGIQFLRDDPLVLAPVVQIGLVAAAVVASRASSLADTSKYGSNVSYIESAKEKIYATNGRYNPMDARIYYAARPFEFISRSAQILGAGVSFGLRLAVDLAQNKLFDYGRELQRADELCDILTDLGPAFIKIGQSLSVRTDLLRPAYVEGLTKLQDKVPPFPTSEALEIISRELGLSSVQEVFLDLQPSAGPIAAASLGQVYKARMMVPVEQVAEQEGDGTFVPPLINYEEADVAVKVQRPGIVNSISLDLHIIRTMAPILKEAAGLESDLVTIVDSLGEGFVDELNYRMEAQNAAIFMESIADTPLSGLVFAPEVVAEATSSKVLTTRWVVGDRLEESPKEEISKMCSIAMNTYLTMMLQSPILHADPHPGNLRRTPEGKLCIMDWGLVTSIAPDLQETYIEHIAHLVSKDYGEVPGDLVKLGFVGQGMEEAAMEQGVVEVLADVYGKWAMGGGAAKVDVGNVISQLNGLTEKFGNFFRLPPYFVYIARAFGVLEGIGLQSNPDYAIVGECLPYIAQRLLTSSAYAGNKARTSAALESFLYGKEKVQADRVIDAERITLLIDGFNSYQTSSGDSLRKRDAKMHSMALPSSASGGQASASVLEAKGYEEEELSFSFFGGDSASGSLVSEKDQVARQNSLPSTPSKTDRVRAVDETAEMIVRLLVDTASPSPSSPVLSGSIALNQVSESAAVEENALQTLVLEETAKLAGALSRKQWQALRTRSGRTSTGRSRLGTLVDPLGIFREGKLVNTDDNDEKILASASAIVEALTKSSMKSVRGDGEELDGDSFSGSLVSPVLSSSLRSLSPQEALQISSIIGEKLWSRRRELARLGGKFAQIAIRQARDRVSG